ncbi:MAG: AbrB/MazE/SpoVT family DNA-binding domain-containing protein [Nanoarchaeota archaeon]
MSISLTRMSSKGQVVIPEEIRTRTSLKIGEQLLVFDLEDSIVLKRISRLKKAKNVDEFDRAFSSLWKTAKEQGVTSKDIEEEITGYREEHAESHT